MLMRMCSQVSINISELYQQILSQMKLTMLMMMCSQTQIATLFVPPAIEECVSPTPCLYTDYKYTVGVWARCSRTCAVGVRSRPLYCTDSFGLEYPITSCAALTDMPNTTQPCDTGVGCPSDGNPCQVMITY